MTTPRRRHVDIPDTSRYSRRDFLAGTGATGAAIIAPAFVPLRVSAAPASTEFRALPDPAKEGGMPLMQALAQRRSTREFSARKIPDQVLSNLLWAAYGVNRASGDRTAPCWRHIVAIDVYAAMEDGLWLYDPKRHALVPHPAGDIRAQTGQQDFVGRAPLNLVYVANGSRMSELTPENRKLYCSVDAAFIGQNVYLYCASAGLATVFRGAVDYPKLARAMRLDHDQFVAFAQTVGYPKEM
ncbi:MAG: SagB/ThcOx family dehydrogenase [Burkholderiales bacterium]|nr:SagB/ThcOx family dehydrogenase [Burkholderiales bacterium]